MSYPVYVVFLVLDYLCPYFYKILVFSALSKFKQKRYLAKTVFINVMDGSNNSPSQAHEWDCPWFAKPLPGLKGPDRHNFQKNVPYANSFLSDKMSMFIIDQIFPAKRWCMLVDLETPDFCKGSGLVTSVQCYDWIRTL